MGHTKKLRFAVITGVGLIILAGEGVAMAQNGLTAGLALSNVIFTQQVGGIEADNFSLFVDRETLKDSEVAVSRLKLEDATITDLCMSAPIKLPGLGDRRFQMRAPGASTKATNLVIGAKELNGTMTMTNPQIGVDAQQLSDKAEPGSFGISMTHLSAKNQLIYATSLSADKLTAAGGQIKVVKEGEGEC
ncbi:DUF6230 family protein [Corynebacterium sp. CCUG 70398]|uniref:DUF6230 family protein n=1 Tax=Corynebacterium sp. CCUG 70398 TaxID=2823891 RepID=UPI00210D76A5|nr:DUF6230 family protein [Corynebacterium sp. CCUG 70398]MCQ4621997.1 hypothetical protein [Corynebacterium sp. CCUG 70398]